MQRTTSHAKSYTECHRSNDQITDDAPLFVRPRGRLLGAGAFNTLVGGGVARAATASPPSSSEGVAGLPHFVPTAKRVIYLFQSGGPSHIDLFDYHPRLRQLHGTELPDSVRNGQRITGMTSGQTTFPVVAPMFNFTRCGQVGTWVSDLLPYTSKIVDDLTIIKTVHTEAINHDPAITYINTGTQQLGKPSMGAWLATAWGARRGTCQPTWL